MTRTDDQAAPSLLNLLSVSKRIGHRWIVREAAFTLHRGQICGLLGPNGAGKTTLMRMVVGLVHPTRGSISVLGRNVEKEHVATASMIGALIESPGVYGHLSILQQLVYSAQLVGMRRAQARGHAMELLTLVGLQQSFATKGFQLSHGQRQRFGIAQALVGWPPLLILDEPARGLDPRGMRAMGILLRSLAAERDMGILVSSHMLGDVARTCDLCAVMNAGQIVAFGRTTELLQSSQSSSRWRLRVSDMSRTIQIMDARAAIWSAGDERDVVVVEVSGEIGSLVDTLRAAGVSVHEIRRAPSDLEQVYLALVETENISVTATTNAAGAGDN